MAHWHKKHDTSASVAVEFLQWPHGRPTLYKGKRRVSSRTGRLRRGAAMVTTTVKAVIDSNRSLLIRNVIPCEELYDNLAKLNVLPDTMLRDVKVWCDMT